MPHWPRGIAVEVRHTALNSRDHSWGPARHTEHTGSRLGSGTPHRTHQDRGWGPARHTELTGSQLSSSMPHWTHRIATGQGDGGGRRGGRGGEGEGEETDIKSNNPHLTGGELTWNLKMMVFNRNLLFQGFIIRLHASFRGCSYTLRVPPPLPNNIHQQNNFTFTRESL